MNAPDESPIPLKSISPARISAESIVAEVLAGWPEVIPVFLQHRLGCVGCAMSPFDTLADVARIYQLDASEFLDEIKTAARCQEAGQSACA
jgi:hybrid cluster-associated redox disulfide protein